MLLPVIALSRTAPEVTLIVELDNWVWYTDEGDATRHAAVRETAPPLPANSMWAFKRHMIVADVVPVGGQPAAGTFFAHGVALNTPTASQPAPGRPIADFPRNQTRDFVLEIMTPEQAQVGSLVGFFLGSGQRPPGVPRGSGFCRYSADPAPLWVSGDRAAL